MMWRVTKGCVELTARVVADLGDRLVVVGDVCTPYTPFLHDTALKRTDDGYIHVTDALAAVEDVSARILGPANVLSAAMLRGPIDVRQRVTRPRR
jgi:hypothetical protein